MSTIAQPSQAFERTRKAVIGFYYNNKNLSETELRATIALMSTQTGLTQPEQEALFETLTTEGYLNLVSPAL